MEGTDRGIDEAIAARKACHLRWVLRRHDFFERPRTSVTRGHLTLLCTECSLWPSLPPHASPRASCSEPMPGNTQGRKTAPSLTLEQIGAAAAFERCRACRPDLRWGADQEAGAFKSLGLWLGAVERAASVLNKQLRAEQNH